MTQFEVLLVFLIVLALLYGIFQRMKRDSAEACVQDISKRCSQLNKQRNTLAREFLLYVIPGEKIKKVERQKSDPCLTFVTHGGLRGLVASDLSEQELAIMSRVDELLDGRIARDGDQFEIPE